MPGPDGDRYQVARAALAQIVLPVAIIGAEHEGRRSCSTGTAMYVSFAPPRVAIAQHPGSRTTKLIQASRVFSVSLLHRDQLPAAAAAGRGSRTEDKFRELGLPTVERENAPPGVAGSATVLWCAVTDSIDVGDHLLFIGDVTAHLVDGDAPTPLIRYRRRYGAIGPELSEEAPEGYPT